MAYGYKSNECESMIELITTPFFMLCVLVIIALCVGIEIGVDNERNRNRHKDIYK